MTDHRTDLRDVLDSFLVNAATGECVAGEIWRDVSSMGLPWIGVSESAGGAGGSYTDLCIVLERLGYYAADMPLTETATASWALASAGMQMSTEALTFVLHPDHQSTPRLIDVPWAHRVEHLVVLGRHSVQPGLSVELYDLRRLVTRAGTNLAGEPRDEVTLDDRALLAVGTSQLTAEAIRYRSALSTSHLILGAAQRVLDLTAEHTRSRVQFGRSLARFQAVQHQLAELAGTIQLGRAITQEATAVAHSNDWTNPVVLAARVQTARTATTSIRIGHQLHGALGFTLDHLLNRSTRRLMAWRDENAGEVDWQERLGAYAMSVGSRQLWTHICADPPSPDDIAPHDAEP